MSDDKREAASTGEKIQPPQEGGIGMFWWGIIAGIAITALVFVKPLLGFARDAFTNIMPIFFSPGLLEISLGVAGFFLVILINYWIWRREGRDEWVEMPEDEE